MATVDVIQFSHGNGNKVFDTTGLPRRASVDGVPYRVSADAFEREAMFVGEGVCPVCQERLIVKQHLDDGEVAGVCPTCGIGWILRAATEDEKWMGDMIVKAIYDGRWR